MALGIINSALDQACVDKVTGLEHIARTGPDANGRVVKGSLSGDRAIDGSGGSSNFKREPGQLT